MTKSPPMTPVNRQRSSKHPLLTPSSSLTSSAVKRARFADVLFMPATTPSSSSIYKTPSASRSGAGVKSILKSSPTPRRVCGSPFLHSSPTPQEKRPGFKNNNTAFNSDNSNNNTSINYHNNNNNINSIKTINSGGHSGLALLTEIYASSRDPPSLETIANTVCTALEEKNQSNALVIYGAFYMTVRAPKKIVVTPQLLMRSEQILKYARRDLLAAEQDRADPMASKRIALIVKCVDYLLFVREVAESLDNSLVQWFYSHALQALGNPASPKSIVTGYFHLFSNQYVPRSVTPQIVASFLTILNGSQRFSTQNLISESLCIFKVFLFQPNSAAVLMSRPQDWLPRTVYSLVDSSSQVRLKALHVLRACHALTLTSPHYGPKLAKTLGHVFRKPLDDNGAMLISMFEYAFQDFFNPVGAEAAAGVWGTMLLLLGPAFHSWEYRSKWLEIAERSVFVRKPGNPTAQTALLRVWRNLAYISADRPLSVANTSSVKDLKMMVAPLQHLISTTSAPLVLSEAVDNWVRVVYSCLSPASVYSSKEEFGLVWTRAVDSCVCTMLLANDQRVRILAVVKQLLFQRHSTQTGSHMPSNLILGSPTKSGANYHNYSGAPTRWLAGRILEGDVFDINDIPSFPSKWTREHYSLIRSTLLDTILPQCINNNGTEKFVEIWKLFLSLLLSPSLSKGPTESGSADEMFVLAINDSLTVLDQLKGGSDYGLLMHLVNILEPTFSQILSLPSEDALILTVDSSLRIVGLASGATQEPELTEKPYQIGPLTLFWSIILKQQQSVRAVGRPDIKLLDTYSPLSVDMLREVSTVLTKIAFNTEFKLEPLWMKLYSIVFNSTDLAICEDLITVNNLVRLHTCIQFVIDFRKPWEGFMTDSFSLPENQYEDLAAITSSQRDASYETMACWLKCLEKINSLLSNSALLEEYCRDVLKSAPHAEIFFNHLCYTALTQQSALSVVTAASAGRNSSPRVKKRSTPDLPNNYSDLFQSAPFEKLITLVLAASDMLPETVALGYKLLQLLFFQRDHFECLLDGQYALLLRIAHLDLGVESQWYVFWREVLECFEGLGLSSRSQLFKTRGKRKNRATAPVKYCYEWSLRVIDFFVALYGDGTAGLSGLVKQALNCFVERHTRISMPEKLLAIVDDESVNVEDDIEFKLKSAYKRTGSSKNAEVTHIVSNAQQISSSSESEHEHEKHSTLIGHSDLAQADLMILDEQKPQSAESAHDVAEKSEQHFEETKEDHNPAIKIRLESVADVDLTQDEDKVVDMEIDSPVPDLVHTPKKQTSGGLAGDSVPVIDVSPVTLSSSVPTSSDDEYEFKHLTLRSTRLNSNSKNGITTAVRIVEPEEADTVMTEETDTVMTEEELSIHSAATDEPATTDEVKTELEMNDAVVIVGDDASDDPSTKSSRGSQRRSKRKAAREAAAAFSNTNGSNKRKQSSSAPSSAEPADLPRKSKRAKSVYKNKPEVSSLITALDLYTREIKSNWPAIAVTTATGAHEGDPVCVEEEQRIELSIKDKQRAFELETRLLEALSHTRRLLISDNYS